MLFCNVKYLTGFAAVGLPTRFADGVFGGLAGFVFLKELPLLRLNLAFPLDSGSPSKVPRSLGTCSQSIIHVSAHFLFYNCSFCLFMV